jgi:alkanesulfonate monooxygenase SsuD/methylene tetrahydromethanopterin reductase-like flavin-dependent oxidoreductase (luciferase family)
MDQALALYHRDFRASRYLAQPHTMLALNVVAAASDAEARRLFTTAQQSFVNLRRGRAGLIPPPVDDIEAYWEPHEKAGVERALACSVVGDAQTVQRGIAAFVDRHRPDELLLVANVFDHAARLRSFEIAAEVMGHGAAAAR